jgi:hypothetical protein
MAGVVPLVAQNWAAAGQGENQSLFSIEMTDIMNLFD